MLSSSNSDVLDGSIMSEVYSNARPVRG